MACCTTTSMATATGTARSTHWRNRSAGWPTTSTRRSTNRAISDRTKTSAANLFGSSPVGRRRRPAGLLEAGRYCHPQPTGQEAILYEAAGMSPLCALHSSAFPPFPFSDWRCRHRFPSKYRGSFGMTDAGKNNAEEGRAQRKPHRTEPDSGSTSNAGKDGSRSATTEKKTAERKTTLETDEGKKAVTSHTHSKGKTSGMSRANRKTIENRKEDGGKENDHPSLPSHLRFCHFLFCQKPVRIVVWSRSPISRRAARTISRSESSASARMRAT